MATLVVGMGAQAVAAVVAAAVVASALSKFGFWVDELFRFPRFNEVAEAVKARQGFRGPPQ